MKECCFLANSGKAAAVIVAAGSSSRMNLNSSSTGNSDKIKENLLGIPCVVHALLAFEEAELVGQTVVVTRRENIDEFEKYRIKYNLKKLFAVAEGGFCRQESASFGFFAASEEYGIIAVHDGARPLVTPAEIDAVIVSALENGAAIAATSVKNTVKIVGKNGFVTETPDRSRLVSAATPQAFRREIYREMVSRFRGEFIRFTDDAGMAEALGYKVKTVPCSYENIKITTPEDFYIAEKLLIGKSGK